MAAFCYQSYRFFIEPDMTLPRGYTLLQSFYGNGHEYTSSLLEAKFEGQHHYVLVFRGTEASLSHPIDSLRDIHTDLELQQVPYPPNIAESMAHKGFVKLYDSLKTWHLFEADQAIPQVLSKLDTTCPLFIAGHSLGGALATLAAVDILSHTQFRTVAVYTFASPRVGNDTFAKAYNELLPNTVRVVNTNDYVPLEPQVQIPFQEPLSYFHVAGKFPVTFQTDSLLTNHSIVHYFHALAELEPTYYQSLCAQNPGFCPPDTAQSVSRSDVINDASSLRGGTLPTGRPSIFQSFLRMKRNGHVDTKKTLHHQSSKSKHQ